MQLLVQLHRNYSNKVGKAVAIIRRIAIMTLFLVFLFLSIFSSRSDAFIPFLSSKIVTRGIKMTATDDLHHSIKNYLSYLQSKFENENIRFVVQGAGAILETSGKLTNLRYSNTPSKGQLATVSAANDFECHFVLNEIKSIKHVVLDKKEVLHVIRFINAADQTLLSLIFNKMEANKWNELIDQYNTVYII